MINKFLVYYDGHQLPLFKYSSNDNNDRNDNKRMMMLLMLLLLLPVRVKDDA